MTTPAPGNDDEAQLGELAVRQGFVTADRLKQFLHQLAVERSRGARLSLGDLLIRCEILTPALLRRMLGVQGKAILYCPACALRFNILRHDPDRDYFCKQCKGKLEPTKTDDPTEYDWTSATPPSASPSSPSRRSWSARTGTSGCTPSPSAT